jgi:hypothetical protein
MRRREVLTVGIAVTLFLAGCGSSGEPSSSNSGEPRSNDTALAARARASLVATLTDTPWRLPPLHSTECLDQRQSSRTTSDDPAADNYQDSIYCSLKSSAMKHLLQRLDRGFGAALTATQKACINRKVTRDQIAALLTAEVAQVRSGDDRAAIVAEFDHQLAASIRQCARH